MIKSFVSRNLWQKLLALGLAVFIWALAPSNKKDGFAESQFFIPISYVNVPRDLEMVGNPLQSLSLSVTVTSGRIGDINPAQFRATVDLSQVREGENIITIEPYQIKGPERARIMRITPSSLELSFEKRVEKVLIIQPVVVGEPMEGHLIQKVVMNPDQVLVHGPSSILNEIEKLETKAIEVDGLSNTLEMEAKVLFPQGIQPMPPWPEFYTARVVVVSEPITKTFEHIPIGLVNQSYVTKLNPKSFNLQLRGPRNLLDKLTKEDIQAFIDLNQYKPGSYKIKSPTLRLPPEIQVQKVWPTLDLWVQPQSLYE